MSSNLKVNTILPSTGTTIGIGTVGGLINVVGNIDVNSTSGISTFNGLEISGIVTAKAGAAVTYYGDGSNLTGVMPLAGGTFSGDVIFSGDGTNITFDKSADDFIFNDGAKAAFGTGSDLQIYHSTTSNSFITNSTGYLLINSTGGDNIIRSNTNVYLQPASGESGVTAIANGAVELYHDNSKKFETSSSGATLTGDLYATSRLLVNTTSAGESNGDEATFANTGGNAGITIRSAVNAETKIYFSEGTSGGSQYRGTINYNHNTNYMAFSANETEKMRILGTGGITFNGDTAAANALDDYEEGSWTPIFTDDGTSGNSASSYTHQLGWYTKIGNIVNLQCRISGANTSGMNQSHAAYIKNLPFPIKGSSGRLLTGSALLSNCNIDSTTMGIGVLSNVGSSGGQDYSFFRIFQTKDNTPWVSIKVSQFPSGNHEILINLTYRTT